MADATDAEIEDAVANAVETEETEVEEVLEEEESTDEPEEETEVEDEEPAHKPSRAANRIQTLSNAVKEERARGEAIQRELADLKAQQNTRSNLSHEEAARIREEKLSLLEPQEKRAFLQDEEIQRLKQAQLATQFHVIDSGDRAAYEAKATLNPVYAKHQAAVEKALASLRQNGNNAAREELLKWVIGHEALNAKPSKAAAANKQAAASRVTAAKGKPTSARGDTGFYTGKGSTPEDRLRGVLI